MLTACTRSWLTRTLAPASAIVLIPGCCPEKPSSAGPGSTVDSAAIGDGNARVESPSHVDLVSEAALVETNWREVADRQCCLDAALVRWLPSGPAFPQLMLDLTSEKMAVLTVGGENRLPSILPRRFFVDVITAAEMAGAPIDLPEGSHRIAAVESGFLLGVSKGEFGGGLYFFRTPGGQAIAPRLGENLLGDVAVRGIIPTGPREVMVLQGSYLANVVCVSQDHTGAWKETARFSREVDGALGPDDTSKGKAGDESAIIATSGGDVLVAGCRSGVRSLTRIPLQEIFERREAAEDRVLARPAAEPPCATQILKPTSARRFIDGTIAVTTRHTLTLLEPDGDEFVQRWYTRTSRCR